MNNKYNILKTAYMFAKLNILFVTKKIISFRWSLNQLKREDKGLSDHLELSIHY